MAQITQDGAGTLHGIGGSERRLTGGQRKERNRISLLKKHRPAQRLMTSLLAVDFVAYRNERRRGGKPEHSAFGTCPLMSRVRHINQRMELAPRSRDEECEAAVMRVCANLFGLRRYSHCSRNPIS